MRIKIILLAVLCMPNMHGMDNPRDPNNLRELEMGEMAANPAPNNLQNVSVEPIQNQAPASVPQVTTNNAVQNNIFQPPQSLKLKWCGIQLFLVLSVGVIGYFIQHIPQDDIQDRQVKEQAQQEIIYNLINEIYKLTRKH